MAISGGDRACPWTVVPRRYSVEQVSSVVGQVKHFIASSVPGGAVSPVLRKTVILWLLYVSGQPAALVS
jgi:hypothetical protein